jgi:hypothetical protein
MNFNGNDAIGLFKKRALVTLSERLMEEQQNFAANVTKKTSIANTTFI